MTQPPSLDEAALAAERCARAVIEDVLNIPFIDAANYHLDQLPMWGKFVASIDALRAALNAQPKHSDDMNDKVLRYLAAEEAQPDDLLIRIENHVRSMWVTWKQLGKTVDADTVVAWIQDAQPQPERTVPSIADGAAPIKEAAKTLKRELFGPGGSPGFVGVGEKEIHVYLHCSRREWRSDRPAEWGGFPIHWHYEVGRAVASGAAPLSGNPRFCTIE